jgi:hypothetical protein
VFSAYRILREGKHPADGEDTTDREAQTLTMIMLGIARSLRLNVVLYVSKV